MFSGGGSLGRDNGSAPITLLRTCADGLPLEIYIVVCIFNYSYYKKLYFYIVVIIKNCTFTKTNDMKSNTTTFEFKGQKFTSSGHLHNMFMKGLINRVITPFNEFKNELVYSDLKGNHIVTFTHDISFGFSFNPTELKID